MDIRNAGFRHFLNITRDIQQNRLVFQKENKDLTKERIDEYFNEYNNVFNFAQSELVKLQKTISKDELIKNAFMLLILDKYNWINKSNCNKLYDVCSLYNR